MANADRAALNYLAGSGAVPVQLIVRDGAAALSSAAKISREAAEVWWMPAAYAGPVIQSARKLAGDNPNAAALTEALREAAGEVSVALTPHSVALDRAIVAVRRLEKAMDELCRSGRLQEFNKQYRAARAAAKAEGHAFMTYSQALTRLRKALVPVLVSGGDLTKAQGIFASIFR